MSKWALVTTVGPVGGFIASGRRSRDLWWGSTWLSECVRHVALDLMSEPADPELSIRLLLPSPERVREITERVQREPMAYGGRVTNHLEVEIEAASAGEVAQLAARCERTARRYVADQLRSGLADLENGKGRRRAKRVREALGSVLERELFDAQVEAIETGDFVEVYSAWAPVTRSLKDALKRAWKLLDGRKAARLFDRPSWTREGRAKCDLDPGRDSVLKTANTTDRRVQGPEAGQRHLARRILGIGPEEELDALGLARRLAIFDPGPDLQRLPFPPLSRVTADPWLHQVANDPATAADLQWIRWELERDEVQDNPFFFTWCSPARDPERPWNRDDRERGEGILPFDVSFLFENGLDALLEQVSRMQQRVGRSPDKLQEARRDLAKLRPRVEKLHREHGAPHPYYALLMMDGDGVGHALMEEEDLEERGKLVEALDRFADQVDGVEWIVREHHGCAFYVGGDDLAAYLPLNQVLPAVRKIVERFSQVQAAFPAEPGVSISAGVVLAHVKSDLRAVRRRAQRALATAKKERREAMRAGSTHARSVEGWATLVDAPRSGEERMTVGPVAALLDDVETWVHLLESERLSLRSAGFLEELAERFAGPAGEGKCGIELAAYRLLAQSRRSEKKPGDRLSSRLGELKLGGWRLASHLAAELAIARRLRKGGSTGPFREAAA